MLYSEIEGIGKLSKFTLGTVQLGMNYGMANTTGQPSERQAFEILEESASAGVNSLDTAVAYGTSERVIGEYLRTRRSRFTITSKFKVLGTDPVREFEEQKRHTLNCLGPVDFYFFHDAHQMKAYGERLRDAMEKMKEAGEVKILGASVYEASEVEAFLDYEWLSAVQIPMNILDCRISQSGLLEELHKKGVTVFVRRVLLPGLLCMEQVPERYDFLASYVGEFRDIAKSEGMTLRELAVSYIRDLPGVSSLVLGCERKEQVKENAELVDAKRISVAGIEAVRSLAKKVPIEEAMDRIMGKK